MNVREVEPSMWRDWFRFGTMPSARFTIPFAFPIGDDRWLKVFYNADVILDRLRIAEHMNQLRAPSRNPMRLGCSILAKFG